MIEKVKSKKILLTSAGFENPEVRREFLKLVNKPSSEIRIIFVPTASRTKEELFYVEKSRKELLKIGIKEENIKTFDLDHEVSYDEVDSFDVIYVCGGNTFYLLKKVRETGFDKIINQFLENNRIYVGVSAGSYIMCPTIEMATWKHTDRNDVGLKDLTGLNIVSFLVTVHFETKYKEVIEKETNNSKYPVKILTDNQALLVFNDEEKIVGEAHEA